MSRIHETPELIGQGLTDEIYANVLSALDSEWDDIPPILAALHQSDIADLLERLPIDHRYQVVKMLPNDRLGDVISELGDGVKEGVLRSLGREDLKEALENLPSDDVVDLVQGLADDQAGETIENISSGEKVLLMYPEDTAGGLMQLETAMFSGEKRVGDVLKYIREDHEDMPENIQTIYVVDGSNMLQGSVSVSRLVRLGLDKKLNEVMRTDPVSVMPETSQADVARVFEKYDVINCAVVDEWGHLLGVIMIDDVLDVVLEEQEKRLMRAAGLEGGEDLFSPMMSTTRKRLPWLIINLLTAILASFVIAQFEGEISQLVALAVLMPIVASMGGNAGTQTLVVTTRGLALKQITFSNAYTLLKKEVLVGSFNGLILALLVAAGTYAIYGNAMLGAVIFVATIVNHLLAAFAGNLIPVILEKLGKDPAVSSGILLTTVTDVGGFFAFLGLAALFLL